MTVGLIGKQAREKGIKGTFIGGDGWDSDCDPAKIREAMQNIKDYLAVSGQIILAGFLRLKRRRFIQFYILWYQKHG